MNIVLPIIFFAVCLGLFVRRMTLAHWAILASWIALVIAYNYFKR